MRVEGNPDMQNKSQKGEVKLILEALAYLDKFFWDEPKPPRYNDLWDETCILIIQRLMWGGTFKTLVKKSVYLNKFFLDVFLNWIGAIIKVLDRKNSMN